MLKDYRPAQHRLADVPCEMSAMSSLTELIDPGALRALVGAFARTTGTGIAVFSLQGEALASEGWRHFCRRFPLPSSCVDCHDRLPAAAPASAALPAVRRCRPGLIDCVLPLSIDEVPLAWLASSHFLECTPAPASFNHIACADGRDEGTWLAAVAELPVIGPERQAELIDQLRVLGELIIRMGSERRRAQAAEARLVRVQQAPQSLQRYRSLLLHARDIILFVRSHDGRILDANRAAERAYGYSRQELLALDIGALRSRGQAAALRDDMAAVDEMGVQFETEHVDRAGRCFPVEVGSARIELDGESVLLSIVRDISERKRAQARLRQLNEALQQGQEATLIYNVALLIEFANPAFCRLFGYTAQEIVGQPMSLIEGPAEDGNPSQESTRRYADIHGQFRGEARRRRKDGGMLSVLLSVAPVHDDGGGCAGYVSVMTDLTEIKEAQERLRQLAHYDSLTQLPNRKLFLDRLQLALKLARRSGAAAALLFLDLDNFKSVNDAFGHPVGDALLQQVALRLVVAVREQDTVARLAGDEFVVLLPGVGQAADASRIAAKILAVFERPFRLDTREVRSGVSIGIALYPTDADDVDELMKCADRAMYRSKRQGRNTATFFSTLPQAD
jgi:diguanylate cyclase (GGDEF)-like protein/PAS domain S-box-containing protein